MGEEPKSGGGARARRVVVVVAIVLVALAGAFAWYVGDYYHASEEALAIVADEDGDADGGIHSYFGDYGMQAGDGTPRVSREDQQEQTAEAIARALSAAS